MALRRVLNLMSQVSNQMGELGYLYFLGGTGGSPVQEQVKACGYQILPSNISISSLR
jgi:hypothetical protein